MQGKPFLSLTDSPRHHTQGPGFQLRTLWTFLTLTPENYPRIRRRNNEDGGASVVRRARSANRYESRRQTPVCILLGRDVWTVRQAIQMGQPFVFRAQSAEITS